MRLFDIAYIKVIISFHTCDINLKAVSNEQSKSGKVITNKTDETKHKSVSFR